MKQATHAWIDWPTPDFFARATAASVKDAVLTVAIVWKQVRGRFGSK